MHADNAIQANPTTTLDQVNNWGRTQDITGGQTEQLVKVQLPESMSFFVVSVRAQSVSQGTPPNTDVLYPFALVEWGNGNVLNRDLVDCTGGVLMTVVGTTVMVTVMLLTKDGQQPTTPPSGMGIIPPGARFMAFATVGILPYPQHNPQFETASIGAAAPSGSIIGSSSTTVQGKMSKIYWSADNTTSNPVFIWLADEAVPGSLAADPDLALDVLVIPPGGSMGNLTYPNGKPFLTGVSYEASSTLTTFTAGVTPAGFQMRLTVETERS